MTTRLGLAVQLPAVVDSLAVVQLCQNASAASAAQQNFVQKFVRTGCALLAGSLFLLLPEAHLINRS